MQRLGAGESLACLRQLSEKPVTQAKGQCQEPRSLGYLTAA